MKAILNLDQDADHDTLPAEYVDKLKFRVVGGDAVPYFQKGCEFDGEHALALCKNGQASPADDECSFALGRTSVQQKTDARKYLAAMRGIKPGKDMVLFMTEVIEDYAPGSTDENPEYVWGRNRAAFEDAKEELKKTESPI